MTKLSLGLRKVGRVAERWQRWRNYSQATVKIRCRGKCEATGEKLLENPDWHHLFDRDWEPWSSHPSVCLAVMRSVHNDLERELLPALHDALRWKALRALAAEFNAVDWFQMTTRVGDNALDAWRRLIPYLEERFEYDLRSNSIQPKGL